MIFEPPTEKHEPMNKNRRKRKNKHSSVEFSVSFLNKELSQLPIILTE